MAELEFMKFVSDYGPGGMLVIILLYLALKGQFSVTFRYPRDRKKSEEDHS